MAPPPLTCAPTYPSPRHAPAPRSPAPRPTPRRSVSGSDDDAAPAIPPMADDAVAGAACHCAPPARGSSDDGHHHQQDVIMLRRTRSGRAFPPPISVIGKGGRPWLSLRAHREGGRLVLREMRLPSQELLQPCKEDGRFKLLIHPEAGGRLPAAAPQERQGKDKSAHA